MGSHTQPIDSASQEERPSVHGIRIAHFLALLSGGAVVVLSSLGDKQWHEAHPGSNGLATPIPLWVAILWFALPVIPYLISGLLLSAQNEEFLALGAGASTGLFGLAFLFGLSVLGSLALLNFSPGPYDPLIGIATLLFLACCVWVIVSAIRIGSESWPPFVVGLVLTFGSLALANHALEQTEYRLDREYQQKKAEENSGTIIPRTDARRNIVYLSSCLLNYVWRPVPFPASLDPWPEALRCDVRFSATMIQDFTLSYTPHVDPIREKIFDFQLVAIPKKKGFANQRPLMIDRRGIVFVKPDWATGTGNGPITVLTSDWKSSKVDGLRERIDTYIKQPGRGDIPVQLTADILGDFHYDTLSSDTSGTTLEANNFVIRYLASKADAPNQFALSVQCQSYGDECLRSYLLDYDGVIRATAEPRQATPKDPPALDCEITMSECKDVSWRLP